MSRRRSTSARKGKRRPKYKIQEEKVEETPQPITKGFTLTPNLKLFFTKLSLGAVAGLLAGVLEFSGTRGLFFGLVILLTSYYIVRYIVGVTEEEITTGKVFLKGSISFFFMFTVVWAIVFQLLQGYPYESIYNLIIRNICM